MTLLGFFIFFVVCNSLNGVKCKKFIKPCFVGDEIENTCSDPSESCHEKLETELKLNRLDGVKVNKYTIVIGRVNLEKRHYLLLMKFIYTAIASKIIFSKPVKRNGASRW